jgi:hypothetical protein
MPGACNARRLQCSAAFHGTRQTARHNFFRDLSAVPAGCAVSGSVVSLVEGPCVNLAGFFKDHLRADRPAIDDLYDALAEREHLASPVGRQYQDANVSAGKVLLSKHVFVRRDQQIELPSISARSRPFLMFFQPTSRSLTDLTECPAKTAFSWTGMFSSSRIRNVTQR